LPAHQIDRGVNGSCIRKRQEIPRLDVQLVSETIDDIQGRQALAALDPRQVAFAAHLDGPSELLLGKAGLLAQLHDSSTELSSKEGLPPVHRQTVGSTLASYVA
jgi:hypothetical protein